MFGLFSRSTDPLPAPSPRHCRSVTSTVSQPCVLTAESLPEVDWDGEKYPGGYGPFAGFTECLTLDYWTLRQRSKDAYYRNLYSRGLIERLVTNIIGEGLRLECEPSTSYLGMSDEQLEDWCESVEDQFALWATGECDHLGVETFGSMQRRVYRDALLCGDVVVVMMRSSIDASTVVTIDGSSVRTPWPQPAIAMGHTIDEGVELSPTGAEVALWVEQTTGEYKRLAMYGERSGRRQAWLVRGLQPAVGKRRGEPLLSIVLQSLRELDRYRDAALRKAAISAIMVGFIKKTQDKISSSPLDGGAMRKDAVSVVDPDGSTRSLQFNSYAPGMMLTELQAGEEPVIQSSVGTDIQLGPFEDAVLRAIAWASEIPPEILFLSFSSNYSASQAALNEFKGYQTKERTRFAEQFPQPIYEDWLLGEALALRIDRSVDVTTAWRDRNPRAFKAWVLASWTGASKPSADLLKQVKAFDLAVNKLKVMTREQGAADLFGTKWGRTIRKLSRENELMNLLGMGDTENSEPDEEDEEDEEDEKKKDGAK